MTRPRLAPLYLAGFTTAFGAHGDRGCVSVRLAAIGGLALIAVGIGLAGWATLAEGGHGTRRS